MKKWFVNIEYVFVSLIIVGLALRLVHVGPTDLIIMIGFLGLAFWYLFFGISGSQGMSAALVPFQLDSPFSKIKSFAMLSIGNSLSISLIGILFQVSKWEGGYFMIMVGGISAVIGLLMSYFILRKNRPEIYNFIFFRQLPVTVMTTVMLSLGNSYTSI
ncbi:MAG: hypothetical protein V9F05_18425 [Chitinophagaceae bacterium]